MAKCERHPPCIPLACQGMAANNETQCACFHGCLMNTTLVSACREAACYPPAARRQRKVRKHKPHANHTYNVAASRRLYPFGGTKESRKHQQAMQPLPCTACLKKQVGRHVIEEQIGDCRHNVKDQFLAPSHAKYSAVVLLWRASISLRQAGQTVERCLLMPLNKQNNVWPFREAFAEKKPPLC